MVFGAIGGLLLVVTLTLISGRLQLTKNRIVYGTPARVSALLSLLPLIGLVLYVVRTGRTVNQPGGLGLFLATIAVSVLLMYGVGWPLGQPPRE